MGSPATGTVGAHAEQFACQFLKSKGLRLLLRNFRRRGGEIDLIMCDDDILVFVEVRYRASDHYIQPERTVDIYKQRRLIRTASLFVARNPQYAEATMRFDIIAVVDSSTPTCEWLRDAFRPEDSAL